MGFEKWFSKANSEQPDTKKSSEGFDVLTISNKEELFRVLDGARMWASKQSGRTIPQEEIKHDIDAILSGRTGKVNSVSDDIMNDRGEMIHLRDLVKGWVKSSLGDIEQKREDLLKENPAYLLETSENISELKYNLAISKSWVSESGSVEYDTPTLQRIIDEVQTKLKSGVTDAELKLPRCIIGSRRSGHHEKIRFALRDKVMQIF